MTGQRAIAWAGAGLLIVGLIGLILAPHLMAPAWLSAFVLVSMIPIGSLTLLIVGGITGGRWASDLGPVLEPAARAAPLLFLAILPVLVFRGRLSGWGLMGAAPDVAKIYLDPLVFDLRSVAAIAIWSYLAWSQTWRSALGAGLGLVAQLVLSSLIPPDWVLTLAPGSTSTGFGLGFGIEQMFAALAFAAILAPQARGRANRDLAGLMVTTLLGAVYFIYVQFLISWYGNIPEKVAWYAARLAPIWQVMAFAAFVFAAALPFLAILHPAVRREPFLMRIVGILALSGIALHIGWLTAPSSGAPILLPALALVLAMAAFLFAPLSRLILLRRRER